MDFHLDADHHDDGTGTRGSSKGTETNVSEEVDGVDGGGVKQVKVVEEEGRGEDNDEGELGEKADAHVESTVTEKEKEVESVATDDEGEEEAIKQVEMAKVDRDSQHDDPKGSEQDTKEGINGSELDESADGRKTVEGEDATGNEEDVAQDEEDQTQACTVQAQGPPGDLFFGRLFSAILHFIRPKMLKKFIRYLYLHLKQMSRDLRIKGSRRLMLYDLCRNQTKNSGEL